MWMRSESSTYYACFSDLVEAAWSSDTIKETKNRHEHHSKNCLNKKTVNIQKYSGQNLKSLKKEEVNLYEHKNNYSERDLHPVLSYFLAHDPQFKCMSKTIYHEKSCKEARGLTTWLHPDMVGVRFPLEYEPETNELLDSFNVNNNEIFSFELKKELLLSNLRKSFFQALSNSGWANRGFLVTSYIQKSKELMNELAKLNEVFGIGVIELNLEAIKSSKVLFPAKEKEIDWDSLNRLIVTNPDFKAFIQSIVADKKSAIIHRYDYDKVLSTESMKKYVRQICS